MNYYENESGTPASNQLSGYFILLLSFGKPAKSHLPYCQVIIPYSVWNHSTSAIRQELPLNPSVVCLIICNALRETGPASIRILLNSSVVV